LKKLTAQNYASRGNGEPDDPDAWDGKWEDTVLTADEKAEARESYLTNRRQSSMLGKAQRYAIGAEGHGEFYRAFDKGMKKVMGGKQWRGNDVE